MEEEPQESSQSHDQNETADSSVMNRSLSLATTANSSSSTLSHLTSVSQQIVQNYDDDESDTDEEEEEPKLKYERLTSPDLKSQDILGRDSASSICLHSRILVLGTHGGKVHPLDLMGNKLRQQEQQQQSASSQVGIVNQVSLDHTGEYVASAASDGKVSIRGLLTSEQDHDVDLNQVQQQQQQQQQFNSSRRGRTRALAVSLDPIFAKSGTGRRFMTGNFVVF